MIQSFISSTAILLILPIIWVTDVTGSYEVEIIFYSYSNPTGRCTQCQSQFLGSFPRCCDDNFYRPILQSCPSETCDTGMRICIRPLSATSCALDLFNREFFANNNSFIFTSSFFGYRNPLVVMNTQRWRGFELLLEPRDFSADGSSLVIDPIPIAINIAVGTSIPETTYRGDAGIAEMNVSFSVRCAADYYGQDCRNLCPNFVSCTECGLSGFTGEFCQLVTDNCDEINCNSDGQCGDDRAVCDCDDGFIGDHCENMDHCRSITCSENGVCMNLLDGFTCLCDPDYTGTLCDSTINDCIDVTSCSNGGTCVDGIADFTCVCNPGFSGTLCEIDIEECVENAINCSGNGRCVDLENSFMCECGVGFTGQQCENLATLSARTSGVIAGGVVGGLIALALVIIIVVTLLLVILKNRKGVDNKNDSGSSKNMIAPGDNPVYDIGTGDIGYTEISNGAIPGSSDQRDLDNPIYGEDMMEQYYAVPDDPAPNLYDTKASPDLLEEEHNYSRIGSGENEVYYSTVPT